MRHLKLATPALSDAAQVQAHQLLTQLRATQPFSLAALSVSEEQFFQFLISVARQYPGEWESLLTAGYMAVARLVGAGVEDVDRWSWRAHQSSRRWFKVR